MILEVLHTIDCLLPFSIKQLVVLHSANAAKQVPSFDKINYSGMSVSNLAYAHITNFVFPRHFQYPPITPHFEVF